MIFVCLSDQECDLITKLMRKALGAAKPDELAITEIDMADELAKVFDGVVVDDAGLLALDLITRAADIDSTGSDARLVRDAQTWLHMNATPSFNTAESPYARAEAGHADSSGE